MSDSSSSTHAVPVMASSSSGVGGRSSSLLLSSTSSSMPSSSTMMMMSSAATSSLPSSTTTSSLLLRSSSSASSTTSTTGGIGSGSSENLPPRTLARVARDVRDLLSKTPHLEGIRLVVDAETGMPCSLSEIMVRIAIPDDSVDCNRLFFDCHLIYHLTWFWFVVHFTLLSPIPLLHTLVHNDNNNNNNKFYFLG